MEENYAVPRFKNGDRRGIIACYGWNFGKVRSPDAQTKAEVPDLSGFLGGLKYPGIEPKVAGWGTRIRT